MPGAGMGIMGIPGITGTTMAEAALFDLLSWMSPAWPIGSFAHSGGLEWAVEAGQVHCRESARDWLAALLHHGALANDAVLFVHAWRAAQAGDAARLAQVAELAHASQTGQERRLEACAQGLAFRRIAIDTAVPGMTGALYARLLADIPPDELTYPVAAAALFACNGIAAEPALTAFLHGALANLVSAAQRLVPLGQTDGQRLLRALREDVLAIAAAAVALPDGDPFEQLGGATLAAELACMAHETQYTRLFRT